MLSETDQRIVTITGEPGIGKSSVARGLANYLKTRSTGIFRNGVVYLNVTNVSSYDMLAKKFVKQYREGIGKAYAKQIEILGSVPMLRKIFEKNNLDVLIIIDDIERCTLSIVEFFDDIINLTTKCKILATS